MNATITLEQLNAAPAAQALAWLDGLYEHSPWIAAAALATRPFQSLAQLKHALVTVVRNSGREAQLGLVRAHPELAGKAAVAGTLTAESTNEQSKAGLAACTAEEFAKLQKLNAAYNAKFGFPFIMAVRGPRGLGLPRHEIIATFERRLEGHPDFELAECLRNIHRIAEIRLNDKFGVTPTLGNQVWDWAEQLAAYSDPGYKEQGQLTVTYLTEAHQTCARKLQQWMKECGFDDTHIDAVGNVVGVYHGGDPKGKRLLTGSHYDTVRNGGKYDGRLGILVPMACVRELHRAGRRLPYGFEVVGFAEEEGQRYKATFLGSGALTGHFDPAWLAQRDADGVSMLDAMHAAGLPGTLETIAAVQRDPRHYLAFIEAHIDAVGNVVGIYRGSDPKAKRLLTGSHYDTVRNGGRYDGRLGILVPMACVRELHAAGRRLPYAFEVVGFAEEEGQRYKATFLGSGALTGHFEPAWLAQQDADGIRMVDAMHAAGLPGTLDTIAACRRDPADYLGFVEAHIEQGPVLNEFDLPLGVVTSINGSARFVGEVIGMASHAGTTPMDRRRDAATAVAELALFVERRGAAVPHLVATMGMLQVPSGSINVVPGRCQFSLDIRATTNEVRDACIDDVLAELKRICERRGLHHRIEETVRAAAAPSDPAWQSRWERAVAATGLPVHRMPSGAGHDAMKLHEVMPQAMLFMRGGNSGISHNPLEEISNDDTELCVRAFQNLLDQLAQETR